MWNCAIKTQTHAGSDADDALLKMLLKMHQVLMRLEGFFKKKKKEKQKDDEKFIFITQKWRVERGRKSQACSIVWLYMNRAFKLSMEDLVTEAVFWLPEQFKVFFLISSLA